MMPKRIIFGKLFFDMKTGFTRITGVFPLPMIHMMTDFMQQNML